MNIKDFFRITLSTSNKLNAKERIYCIEFRVIIGCLLVFICSLINFLIFKTNESFIQGIAIFLLTFVLLEFYSFYEFNIESLKGNPSNLVYYNYIVFGFFLLFLSLLKSIGRV